MTLLGTRELVADAPCPACGGANWARVTPTDDSRGTGRSPGRRAAGAGDRPRALRAREKERHLAWPAGETPGIVENHKPPESPSLDALDFPMYAFIDADAEITATSGTRPACTR
jgi:hypothetical protein